jgi:adenylosuccinate lyase
LEDALLGKTEVTEKMSVERVRQLCDPVNYLGASGRMVDDVLAVD